ncbi:response regulator transcription factor [Vibrio sp. L3-7]|uniref:response regulator transcription factor n=1 Tax=Vibrio sp. L3-7 TaxID=2912253 RepID=UPI001F3973D4|nr:response regulator transcription factor [Vibrio sp. L3-7]MCF7507251.1 response regulator transcription factor [Vibrio sp. L3-7]
MTNQNVLIIDEQPLYREALAELIMDSLNVEDLYKTTDTDKVLKLVKSQSIDLIVIDVTLTNNDGMNLAKIIKAHGYEGKLLFVSSLDNSSLSEVALSLGANGFLSKNESHESIRFALSNIMKGYSLFKSDQKNSSKSTKLSNKEVIVFQYLIQGYSNKLISEKLSLSAKTISTYKTRILSKYRAKSIVELVQLNSTI